MSDRPTPITDAADRVIPGETAYEHSVRRSVAMANLERQLADTQDLAGELIAMIRVNVMRDTFREATIEQVDDHLKPWIQRIATLNQTTQ